MIKTGWVSALAGLLISGLFLALSAWPVYLVGSLTQRVVRAKAWVEVPARVLSVQVNYQRRPRRMGHFDVDLLYAYEWKGKTFEGRRLVFSSLGNDRGDVWNGRWLKRKIEELEDARRSDRSVPVFVDPRNPAESVIYRGMMWIDFAMCCGLMFLFGIFPMGIAEAALHNKTTVERRRRLRGCILGSLVLYAAVELVRGLS